MFQKLNGIEGVKKMKNCLSSNSLRLQWRKVPEKQSIFLLRLQINLQLSLSSLSLKLLQSRKSRLRISLNWLLPVPQSRSVKLWKMLRKRAEPSFRNGKRYWLENNKIRSRDRNEKRMSGPDVQLDFSTLILNLTIKMSVMKNSQIKDWIYKLANMKLTNQQTKQMSI